MFTGLIQGLGTLARRGEDEIEISCLPAVRELILPDLAVGDSVAVDGVCLTVVEILPQGFVAIASPETFSRTTLGGTTPGNRANAWVNLETSLRAGSKIGGHFVTGHVDGLGCLQELLETGSSWEMTFSAPTEWAPLWQQQIAPYIIPKGSIAVNGISLTVADCDSEGNWFKVAVIPHSFQETNLRYLDRGSLVNLEGDILGKYVAKSIRSGLGNRTIIESQKPETSAPKTMADISPEFLAEHGFI